MNTFNVLATVDVLSKAYINMIVESYRQFYNNQTPKHQGKIHLYLFSNNTFSFEYEGISVQDIGVNIHIASFMNSEKTKTLFKEANILFLPVMETPDSVISDLLICGVPILCHQKSEIRRQLNKQYCLFAGSSDPDTWYNFNHAIDDYANLLEMLYFDPDVQKLLKKKADKKYRRKLNSMENMELKSAVS